MATHNYVRLLGILRKPPKFLKLGNSTAAMFSLIVLNKSRLEKDTYFYNVPTVFTEDEEMVAAIEQYQVNAIIEVEGVITTKNVIKASFCEYCGEKNVKDKATIFVITPIYLCQRESAIQTREEALQKLQQHVEISNKCFVLGTLLRNPELIAIGKKKRNTVRYPIAIQRKYFIHDTNEAHSDYPWVNTIGEQAENDIKYLQVGSVVYVDGYIQTRNATQTSVCNQCQKSYNWKDTAVEIIGYSVEYLQNYLTPEEVEEEHPFDVLLVEESC